MIPGGSLFTVSFENVTVSALQDLCGYLCPALGFAQLEFVELGNVDPVLPSAQSLRLAIQLLAKQTTGTVTPGTGGTINDPVQAGGQTSSPIGQAWQNATTPATISAPGQVITPYPLGMYLYVPMDFRLPQPLPILPGNAVVFKLLANPAAACRLSGSMGIREFGG